MILRIIFFSLCFINLAKAMDVQDMRRPIVRSHSFSTRQDLEALKPTLSRSLSLGNLKLHENGGNNENGKGEVGYDSNSTNFRGESDSEEDGLGLLRINLINVDTGEQRVTYANRSEFPEESDSETGSLVFNHANAENQESLQLAIAHDAYFNWEIDRFIPAPRGIWRLPLIPPRLAYYAPAA